jgi:hypothetical protein
MTAIEVNRGRPNGAHYGCATVMELGLRPAATVAGVIGINAPPAPIVYCDTLLMKPFAT